MRTLTLTVSRVLRPNQQKRRHRVVEAAMELAATGGYEAVNMREVSARSRVSLGTVYRYFSSKDHLLAEALVRWGGELGDRLRERRPRGRTAAARVAEVFERMSRGVAQKPELGIALTRALLSGDPGAFANRDGLAAMMREWLDIAIADEKVRNREVVVEALELLCFASMIELATGQRSAAQVGEQLQRVARVVLAPRSG